MMNRKVLLAFAILLGSSLSASAAQPVPKVQPNPPVAGAAPVGVAVTAMDAVMLGWSAKKALLGKWVMNEQKQKIGKIDDLIITPSDAVSYAIIGVGGFVGVGRHDVAIPMNQLKLEDKNFVLPGATKDAMKALPEFTYNKGNNGLN